MADVALISGVIEPVVRALGLGLYDVEISGSGRARVVRVLVDRLPREREGEHEGGGIDLDTVAAATEAISPVLDTPPVDAWLAGPYSLEVSSPGLERPLRTAAHFRSAVGETISVKIRLGDAPARRDRGLVAVAGDAGFELLAEDGSRVTISYDDVIQARTVFEWGPTPKRSSSTRAGRV
ncbi:MAG: ribosome maturation factor RimP [Acidimicrobiia bacterium]